MSRAPSKSTTELEAESRPSMTKVKFLFWVVLFVCSAALDLLPIHLNFSKDLTRYPRPGQNAPGRGPAGPPLPSAAAPPPPPHQSWSIAQWQVKSCNPQTLTSTVRSLATPCPFVLHLFPFILCFSAASPWPRNLLELPTFPLYILSAP